MSNIPSSAMPHAGPSNNNEGSSGNQDHGGDKKGVSARAGKIADKARDNPKTAIAAGAAVLAGAVAAVAIPMVRARKSGGEQGDTGGTNKSGAQKSASGNDTSKSTDV